MSKSISIVFIILIIIIVGFAYVNYNSLKQMQSELIKKERLLEESEKIIGEKGESLTQLEEKIKEIIEKEETSPQEKSEEIVKANEIQEQLQKNQQELQKLQLKMEEVIERSKSDAEKIALLREEKAKLEMLLAEKEEEWQKQEEESKKIITTLQKEIGQYESKIGIINSQLGDIKKHLETEIKKRKELEENIIQYEARIDNLQGQLTLKQDDEAYAQKISQLQASKKQLEEEIAKKDAYLKQFQQESQILQEQLNDYKQKVEKLQQEMVQALGQKEILIAIKGKLSQLEQEKSKLEKILKEKETQWLEKEQIHKDTIVLLQEEIEKYETNIKEIGNEILVLKKDLTNKESSLKENIEKEIASFASEIEKLKGEVSFYQDIEKTYQDTLQKLQLDKELLEKELLEKGEVIDQQEYLELAKQLTQYREQIGELKNELARAKESEEEARKAQLEVLINLVLEKEGEWTKQNEENKRLITNLKEQLKEYQQEIELIKFDRSLFKEEIATQIELYQEALAQISNKEDQIIILTTQMEQYMQKIEDYEKTLKEIKTKLQQREDVNIQEQQNLMEAIHSLIKERDEYQNNINQCRLQIERLQSEIAELQNKIGLLEKEKGPKYYEVRSGDCLWTIAKHKYNEGIAWIKIFKANQDQIENPDLIFPYQRFILPE